MKKRTAIRATTALGVAAIAAVGVAAVAHDGGLQPLASAQPKAANTPVPTILARGLAQVELTRGAQPVENPLAADGTLPGIARYGYFDDGPLVPAPGTTTEATKSEPDKNTYLVFPHGLKGADASYDYGRHFLFQGHEGGPSGHVTRVNLDADAAHRVTLLGRTPGANDIDGSTWNPFTRRLLITSEAGGGGGIFEAGPSYPSTIAGVPALGFGGYEGVQLDGDGNIWLVSDIGGPAGTVNTKAKQPNSFVYRFVPENVGDLSQGGVLEALQVRGKDGQPIVFHAGQADADILSTAMKDLHTYGNTFRTHWVTVHDTASDGTATFDANAAAKAAGATPFKRPENGQFRPGTGFRQFAFTETGDTNAATQAGEAFGGFGGVFMLTQHGPSSDRGTLRLVIRGDVGHTGFDNLAWWDGDRLAVVEDAGDGLHTDRNALDSGYLVDVTKPVPTPLRFLAEGRDTAATLDSALSSAGTPGYQNEGDNELTGIHVSNGDTTIQGLLGRRVPHLFDGSWRAFYTAQHGDNVTFELVKSR